MKWGENVNGYGEKIKTFRRALKWKQETLGNKVGVTKSYISKLEGEKTTPSLEMLARIAQALGVEIGDLLDKRNPPEVLKEAGAEWIVTVKKLEKEGISPDQVLQWAEIVKKYTQNNKG